MINRMTYGEAHNYEAVDFNDEFADSVGQTGLSQPVFEQRISEIDSSSSRTKNSSHSDGTRSSVTSFLHPNIGQVAGDNGGEGRLIVVSNRVALPKDVRAGGLASALKGALAERGGIWFGWSGQIAEQPRFDVQAGSGLSDQVRNLGFE